MTRVEYIAFVAQALGYQGLMPHELHRRIESLWLQGLSTESAITLMRTPSEQ